MEKEDVNETTDQSSDNPKEITAKLPDKTDEETNKDCGTNEASEEKDVNEATGQRSDNAKLPDNEEGDNKEEEPPRLETKKVCVRLKKLSKNKFLKAFAANNVNEALGQRSDNAKLPDKTANSVESAAVKHDMTLSKFYKGLNTTNRFF